MYSNWKDTSKDPSKLPRLAEEIGERAVDVDVDNDGVGVVAGELNTEDDMVD